MIKIVSYNIKHLRPYKEKIIENLKELKGDIIGLQEADNHTRRRNGDIDQIKYIAEELGYPYYSFCKLIDHTGGAYGHGIVSRYPIKEQQEIPMDAIGKTDHARKYGRYVLDVNGKELVFYNTHNTLGTPEERRANLLQIFAAMSRDPYAVAVGDMNFEPPLMKGFFNTDHFALLNGGNDCGQGIKTFPEGERSTVAIDNIAVTKTLRYHWNEETGAGIEVYRAEGSDHNPIYTYVDFKD